jgi:DNA ligase (NAD+)
MKSGKQKTGKKDQRDLFGAGSGEEGEKKDGAPKKAPKIEGGLSTDPAQKARIAELAERVERYRASYYAGKPEISDAAYDALEDELRDLDPTNAVLAKVGSAALVTEWEKARHEIPMGSLNKAVSQDELMGWLDRCDELLAKDGEPSIRGDLFVAEKLDGISIEVIYKQASGSRRTWRV